MVIDSVTNNSFSNKFLNFLCSLLLLAALFSCSQQTNNSTADLPSDRSISESVQAQLQASPYVSTDSLNIETTNGIVTLSGSTDNLLSKERASEISEAITGVISVVNNLKITSERTDEAIKEDVVRTLSTDPATERWEISVEVNNGLVSLTGNVDSWQEKQLAGTIVSGVKGVEHINNNILVSVNDAREDTEIAAEVSRTLMFDSRIHDNLIEISVENDTVRLAGSIGSAREKRLATEKAYVEGVDSVIADSLQVRPEISSSRFFNQKINNLSPVQIEQAIYNTFVYDPRVPADEIDISVEEGTVVLKGTVKNLNSKLAAADDARNTAGVTSVENNITVERAVVVEPEIPTTDEAIKSRIKNGILRDPYVEEAVISITVKKGVVTLSGDVNSEFEKRQIEQIASDVKGVISINNNLQIEPGSGETTYH